jgi:outer membrane protein assembly factor BamB
MKSGNALAGSVLAPFVRAKARRWASAASLALVLTCAASASPQNPGYVYTANETLNEVDVLRASDHILIASMPTISTPYGIAATQDGKQVYVSTFDGKNIYAFDAESTSSSQHFNSDRSCARSRSLQTANISTCRITMRTLFISSRLGTTR